jgi:predicted RNase H-like HicB family nuclease
MTSIQKSTFILLLKKSALHNRRDEEQPETTDEDQLFLVTIPEFSDRVIMPCTHGKTREEAIRNSEEVIEMYLEAWQVEGESIPEPITLQIA